MAYTHWTLNGRFLKSIYNIAYIINSIVIEKVVDGTPALLLAAKKVMFDKLYF